MTVTQIGSDESCELCAHCGKNEASETGVVFDEDDGTLNDVELCYRCHTSPLASEVDQILRLFPEVTNEQRIEVFESIVTEGIMTKEEPLSWVLDYAGIPREEKLAVIDEVVN